MTLFGVPDDAGQVIHGAYCTSGKRTIKPEGGLLVMQEADKSIKPGHFRRKEMYKQQPGAEALVDELLQVHKIATKKPARKPNRSEGRSR